MTNKLEVAMFGAGCFWGVEEAFRVLSGVMETAVGYMGGELLDPTYEDVCMKNTGHAEVVKVVFDSDKITYEVLLDVFWKNHNPTQFNRQGPDVGSQYRSVIFYSSEDQKFLAEVSLEKLEKSGKYEKKIVTQIVPTQKFYIGEDYHQKYLAKRGLGGCHL